MRELKLDNKFTQRLKLKIDVATGKTLYDFYKKPSQYKINAYNNIKKAFENRCERLKKDYKCEIYIAECSVLSANTFSFTMGTKVLYMNERFEVITEYTYYTAYNVYEFRKIEQ